jgi:hypothetical protein
MINIGSADRAIRFGLGLILLVAPFLPQLREPFLSMGEWRYVLAAVGLVLLGTAIFRVCPAYLLFGVRTCSTPKR